MNEAGRERGYALLAALFFILILELAVMGAVATIRGANQGAARELGWAASDRLAESAWVHASAVVDSGVTRGAGELAEGRYEFAIERLTAGTHIIATGTTHGGHTTRLDGNRAGVSRRHGLVKRDAGQK